MPFPGQFSRYQHVIHLGLTYLYQGPSPEKSRRSEKKNSEQKAAVVACLGNRKIRNTYKQAPLVRLLGRCSPVLVCPKYVCSNFLRARRIQRGFWPVWSDQAIRSGLPSHQPIIRKPVSGTGAQYVRVRKNIHRYSKDACYPPQNNPLLRISHEIPLLG